MHKLLVSVPLYKADDYIESLLSVLKHYNTLFLCTEPSSYVMNSINGEGAMSICIRKSEFNHGGTRNLAVNYGIENGYTHILFITQDVIISQTAINRLSLEMNTENSVIYGRQLPHSNATNYVVDSRSFSYPRSEYIYKMEDDHTIDLKKINISNAFCLYRLDSLKKIGGFNERLIMCEDMDAAMRIIHNGGSIKYNPDICVLHSHNYSLFEEGRRYFDIGVFMRDTLYRYANENSLKIYKGNAIPVRWYGFIFMIRKIANTVFLMLGLNHMYLGNNLKRYLSMHKDYFN